MNSQKRKKEEGEGDNLLMFQDAFFHVPFGKKEKGRVTKEFQVRKGLGKKEEKAFSIDSH